MIVFITYQVVVNILRSTRCSITLQIYVSEIRDTVIKIGRAYLQTLGKRNVDDGWCCMLGWPGEYVSYVSFEGGGDSDRRWGGGWYRWRI
jgi:hypothetical protein